MRMNSEHEGFLSAMIEKGIIFLLIFTPLAFGSVEPWAAGIMEMTAFLLFGAWVVKTWSRDGVVIVRTPVLYFLGGLIVLILFQLLPLPPFILSLLTPSTADLYARFVTTGASAWRTISIAPAATGRELLRLLAYASVFIVVLNHYRTREQIASIVRTVVIMGCLITVFAVIQKLTWNNRLYWIYPTDRESNRDYIWGPYINHNHFAGYLEIAIPLGLGLLLYRAAKTDIAKTRFVRQAAELLGHQHLPQLAWPALAVIIMCAGLFLSLSRGGILGLTASVLLFGAMTRTRKSLRRKTGAISLIGIAILMVVALVSGERIGDRFGELGQEGKIQRPAIWLDSLGIIKDFPVFGTGYGTFRNISIRYQTRNPQVLYDHAHNDYIEHMTDTGLAGLLIAFGLIFVFWSSVLKGWSERRSRFAICIGAGGLAACGAITVHSLTDFNLHIPANALLLAVIAAVTYSVVFQVRRGERACIERRHIRTSSS